MKLALYLGAAVLVLTSTLAVAQPEDLLPDIFDDPPPEAPAPRPRPQPQQPAPAAAPARPATAPGAVIAPAGPAMPTAPTPSGSSAVSIPGLPPNFPTLAELEEMEDAEIDELLGLKPKFDMPAAARRSMERVGVIASAEGGFPSGSLARQPAGLVRAALQGIRGPMVSRWGHILVRRALVSRLHAPSGMSPVEFAALRASLLNRMGEARLAVALLQDVDGNNYDGPLLAAAVDAYLGTGDILGLCPLSRLHPDLRSDGEWILTRAICDSYLGETRAAERRLDRALGTGEAAEIDVRLAQRFAGAAGDAGRAVNIEWDEVETLTLWRLSLARALGIEVPAALRGQTSRMHDYADAMIPAVPLTQRLAAAERAARDGVFSAQAMIDLYSQAYGNEALDEESRASASLLRQAYVATEPVDRVAAMRALWGDDMSYGRLVLTAYAAARLPALNDLADDAGDLVAAMLSAGLDANAMRWLGVVPAGSHAWAQLVLADPRGSVVSDGDFTSFRNNDDSEGSRRSAFLLAGLAALGRMPASDVQDFASEMGIDLAADTPWSQRITQSARAGNPVLVALLAGVGMQGDGWHRMTARHLYHIVRSLNAVGLSAEARMIAAEAVARG